jgi:PAS domain S-box-containing protein
MAAWDWNIPNDQIIWNDQFYLMAGLEPDNEAKSSEFYFSVIHPDDLPVVKRELANAINKTDAYRAVFRIKRADSGKISWMRAFGRIVARANGKATRMVGVMYDITESKVAEQQKDEFIGIASHELRTPVTSIKVYAEALQEKFEILKDADSAELMRKLNVQVDRLEDLIKDLLDTTRIAEGGLSFELEDFDLNEVIKEEVEDVQRLTQKHKIVLQLSELPQIKADRERIMQVLTNLLSNAVKYSPKGGDILVGSAKENGFVKVSVRDRGMGISKAWQGRIFDRFFRVNNPMLQIYSGMGLGLYISAGIVQRHGGMITVDSEEGKGAIFSFTLPVGNGQ